MKKVLLIIAFSFLCCLTMTAFVSAATTNELGTPETVEGIDLTGMNEDRAARIVLVDANGEYHTYFTGYVLSNSTKFKYNFDPINSALGTSYSKNSVVRIEVPDNIEIAADCGDLSSCKELLEIKFFQTSELHTLEYGCFYNNKKLQKLNIPKKVTTIGTLIINNSHLEELVFDDGFSAVLPKDSFKGASGLKKMVFSNQMTTVEDRALDSTLGESLKEFYMGKSLMDLGTNNMAWVKQSVKFYVPAQFLSEVEVITMETYSWWASTACLPTGVIFFTGTRAQAEALIAKSTYDRVFCSSAELVEWDLSVADDDYIPAKGWKIVYNYGICNAFYGGEHALTGTDVASVIDFMTEITVGDLCTRHGCGMGIVKEVIEPIFVDLGISVSEEPDINGKYSISRGYRTNYEAYNAYLKYGTLDCGLVIAAENASGAPLEFADGKVSATNEKVLIIDYGIFTHEHIVLKLVGIDPSINGKNIVMTMFAYDGTEISYLSEKITVCVGE